jgi:hypothetical protein
VIEPFSRLQFSGLQALSRRKVSMVKKLTPRSSLENLKREAKRWLKALRANDAEARARFERATPSGPPDPTLRDVQHALALEYGHAGWSALTAALEHTDADHLLAGPNDTDLVARFLAAACPDHHVCGKPAHLVAIRTAERLLAKHPELVRDSIYTAVVCGDVELVGQLLATRPELAREKGGPNGSAGGRGRVPAFAVQARTAAHPRWEPILYLCFTRLGRAASDENALAIATMLLDRGADPNAYFMAGASRYAPLTGVVGLGEEERPPHPRRDELTRLLLERGANPYDGQVFYNVHFTGDVLWYLKLIYEHTLKAGRGDDWKDPRWSMIDVGGHGLGAHHLLRIAVSKNNLELAEWILAHGADPDAPGPMRDPRSGARPDPSFREMALRHGYAEMADLLGRFGAKRSAYAPEGEDRFVDAVLRLDRGTASRIAAEHPEYLHSPKAMFEAARRDNVEAVRLLIDLGASIEVEDDSKRRPLHVAAEKDAVNVATLLIEHGAEIDPVETNWRNTPLDWASYLQVTRMIDLLAPYSRDLWPLAFAGKVERLRELLNADPGLAKRAWSNGVTPLMRLPDDESKAREIVDLFLANGADPSRRNDEGLTAADIAEGRGMDEVAALLRSRSG